MLTASSAPPSQRARFVLVIALFAVCIASAPGADDPAKRYDDLIAAGHKLLADNKPTEAYASAADAAALDPKRFEAFALEALVMRQQGNFKKASELVERALAIAPEARRPALLKLRAMIAEAGTTQGEFRAHFDAARDAALQHKMAKAAREYEAAWKAKPDEDNAGYQAALGYAALEDYARSVPIARKIASTTGGAAASAKELLEKLKAVVDPIVRGKVAAAEDLLTHGKAREAEPVIKDAIAVDPQPAYTTFLLARSLAGQGRTAPALDAADQAVALGMTSKETRFAAPELASLAREKRFIDLIADTFGNVATNGLAEKLRSARPKRAGPITNSIGMKLAPIPAGTFQMGSPQTEEGRSDDEVPHKVILTRGFFMQTTAVTQAQWSAVMGTAPSHFASQNVPVDQVSWNDANDFCRRLSEKEGKKTASPPRPNGNTPVGLEPPHAFTPATGSKPWAKPDGITATAASICRMMHSSGRG